MEKAKLLQTEIKKIFGDAPVNLVGGSVRDIILGREPKDWDYCTPLSPEEIKTALKKAGRRAYLIGERFGTIGFKVEITEYNDYGGPENIGGWSAQWHSSKQFVYVEVTTYRSEKYDGKTRKPSVEFITDLDSDLSRRDFTINAIVLKEDGTFYDPYGGRLDILAKQIKTVGIAKDRISEDPLRMLRAARFASQLGFTIDPNLIGKMRQLCSSITIVSKERWVQELDKMLMGADPMRGIDVLMQSDVLKYVLPEVYLALQDDEAYKAVASVFVSRNELTMDLDSKWAAIHYFIGYPYTYKENKGEPTFVNHEVVRQELMSGICSRLKFSNERRDNLVKNRIIFNKSIDL